MQEFRLLRADEIEVRPKTMYDDAVQLLLYKDARCDMNILDETVGCTNWKKDYELINGSIACTVYIWDDEKHEWIGKQDVGVESNMEAVKGSYSDAQKRAAFAWGIGRELYTSPRMYFPLNMANVNRDGKLNDTFSVVDIKYKDKRIETLTIMSNKTKNEVTFPRDYKKEAKKDKKVSDAEFRAGIFAEINKLDKDKIKGIAEFFGVESITDMTIEQLQTYKEMTEGKR